ncbi:MAG: HAD family hydrolase [Sedimentisphaerales bacterium]|nr:HAD family hydrolase [Sedimentisphaerales bacterium]
MKAVIFDLDGTITVPHLDFDAIRAEIGAIQGPILEAMEHMSEEELARAEKILDRYEVEAAEQSKLNDGAAEVLASLSDEGRRIGVVTRNCHASVKRVAELHGLNFEAVITREDGPVKPDPFGVFEACRLLGVEAREACLVGDYVFDLMAARRAGSVSILLATNEKYNDFTHEADYVIHGLRELPGVVAEIENGGLVRDED